MYKIAKALIGIIWILDILNINPNVFPFLQPYLGYILNDSNGLNGLFWIVLWLAIPSSSIYVNRNKE